MREIYMLKSRTITWYASVPSQPWFLSAWGGKNIIVKSWSCTKNFCVFIVTIHIRHFFIASRWTSDTSVSRTQCYCREADRDWAARVSSGPTAARIATCSCLPILASSCNPSNWAYTSGSEIEYIHPEALLLWGKDNRSCRIEAFLCISKNSDRIQKRDWLMVLMFFFQPNKKAKIFILTKPLSHSRPPLSSYMFKSFDPPPKKKKQNKKKKKKKTKNTRTLKSSENDVQNSKYIPYLRSAIAIFAFLRGLRLFHLYFSFPLKVCKIKTPGIASSSRVVESNKIGLSSSPRGSLKLVGW